MLISRRIAAVIAGLSLLVAVGSGAELARRIAEHVQAQGRVVYNFRPVTVREFTYAGRPVSFTDLPPSRGDGGYGAVLVVYGDDEVRLRATVAPRPYVESLPGLVRHEDWMRLLRFAPLSGMTEREFLRQLEAGELEDRLVIVTRVARAGADPQTWGRIWRKDWVFDFYEFLPEGGFRHERYAYPQGRPYEDDAPTEHHGMPVLQQDMWQYDAALHVMPEGSGPRIRAADSMLRSAGWTLPVCAVSVFVLLFSMAAVFAPRGDGQRTEP